VQNKRLILASLLLASLVINLDTTIVNVALPTLIRKLHATTSQLQWIVDAYNLVFAALVLAAGSVSDRVGRKGILLAGLGVFSLASIAGGLGSSTGELIAARAFMGLGAAMIFPSTLSLISNTFVERRERAVAIGLWGATAGLGVAFGPIAGGFLLEHFNWSSIFFALAPVAAVTGVVAALVVRTSRDPAAPPPDLPGLALSTAGMALLIYTVIEAPAHGWGSPRTVAGFVVAGVLAVAFVWWERRAAHPMIDVGLFRNLRFTAASGSVTIAFYALSGFIFLVTQYFQFLKGYSPLSTGVRLLPVATSVAVTSVLGTRLAVRIGTKIVVATGLLSLAAGLGWASSVTAGTGYLVIVGQMVLLGCGIGLTSAPATEAIMGVVPTEKAGIGSAINDATRVFGATLGVAVIGSVYASLYASRLTALLAGRLPESLSRVAHDSVGAALTVAERLSPAHPQLAAGVHAAASGAFFHGFQAGCLLAAGVGVIGALLAGLLLPAQPQQRSHARSTGPTERRTPSTAPTLPGSRPTVTDTSSAALTASGAAPAIAVTATAEPAVISMLACVAHCHSAGATALHYHPGDNTAAARRFYRDAFGWDAEPTATSYDPAVETDHQIIRGGVGAAGLLSRLLGRDPAVLDAHADSIAFYVQVPDLDRAVQRIETLGGTLVRGPISGTDGAELALIADPQGALVGLFSQ
jgi:EmrB/QacA subfamily drug resistance transporter